jgi:hypothetical protein
MDIVPIYAKEYTVSMKKTRPRPHPEMSEGTEAFERFQQAVKAVLRVPKESLPPSPFKRAAKAE